MWIIIFILSFYPLLHYSHHILYLEYKLLAK